MGDVHYMISESAKQVGVESHVLRYWEEELDLPIGRTEMGHRYYTEDDIQLFSCIKELKEQGMQLKEIKEIIPDMLRAKKLLKTKQQTPSKPQTQIIQNTPDQSESTSFPTETSASMASEVLTTSPDLEHIRSLFGEVMQETMLNNNKILEENIFKSITEKVSKDMDFLLQAKERQEEDRYRKLDHLIRQQQASHKEASRPTPARYLRRLFGEN